MDFIYIIISKIFWALSGFVVHVGAGRMLGPEVYGEFGVIISFMTINYFIVQNGTYQAIVKYSADDPALRGAIRNTGLKIQVVVSLALTALVMVLAEPIAAVLHDVSLADFIRFSALSIPFSGILFVYIGTLEGARKFNKTAVIYIIYSAAKMMLVLLLIYLGFKLYGVIAGLVAANIIAVLAGYLLCRDKGGEGYFSALKLVKFGLPVLSFFMLIAVLMHIDVLFVKSLMADDSLVGYYTAAKTLSKVIFFVFQAFSIVLLPSVAKAFTDADIAMVKNQIQQSFRYMLMFLLPILAMVIGSAGNFIDLFYRDPYISAMHPLRVLLVAISFLVVTLSLATIIQACGKPRLPTYVLLGSVPPTVFLLYVFIDREGSFGAALAMCVSHFLTALVLGVYILRKFNSLLALSSLLRMALASVIVFYITMKTDFAGPALVLYYGVIFGLYFLMLFLFKEIEKKDLTAVKSMLLNRIARRV